MGSAPGRGVATTLATDLGLREPFPNREGKKMRIETSVTSVSWIPSEAMTGPLRVPVDLGIGHYDDPLPDHIDDLDTARIERNADAAGRLR